MYPTRDESGDAKSPPPAAHIENLCNLVKKLLKKADGDRTKPQAHNKQHNIPLIPGDTVSEGGSVNEYATLIFAKSTKTKYIDPRD
jgi:hypothetical protein